MDLADLTRDLEALQAEALAAIAAAPDVADARGARARHPRQEGPADERPARHRRPAGRGPAQGRRHRQHRPDRHRGARSRSAARSCAGRSSTTRLAAEAVDVTTPGRPIRRGTPHPSNETIARDRRRSSGSSGSWSTRAPRSRTTSRNFQMLNIPPDHPARDLWDTLYVDVEGHLLRTHTSPGQIRVMHEERRRSARCCRAAASATRRSTPATPRSSSRSRG